MKNFKFEVNPVSLMLEGPDLVKNAAAALGLVDTLDGKVDKLLQQDYNVGIRCLSELEVTENEHEFLLKKGWESFQAALSNESGKRKAMSYLCLALCQDRLGEKRVAENTLKEFVEWNHTDTVGMMKRGLKKSGLFGKAKDLLDEKGVTKFAETIGSSIPKNETVDWALGKINDQVEELSSEEIVQALQESASEYLASNNRMISLPET